MKSSKPVPIKQVKPPSMRSERVHSLLYWLAVDGCLNFGEMVAEVGLEPTRGCPRQILSLLWLPISPLGHNQDCIARRTLSVVFYPLELCVIPSG